MTKGQLNWFSIQVRNQVNLNLPADKYILVENEKIPEGFYVNAKPSC